LVFRTGEVVGKIFGSASLRSRFCHIWIDSSIICSAFAIGTLGDAFSNNPALVWSVGTWWGNTWHALSESYDLHRISIFIDQHRG
jgi:hypothetical protein